MVHCIALTSDVAKLASLAILFELLIIDNSFGGVSSLRVKFYHISAW